MPFKLFKKQNKTSQRKLSDFLQIGFHGDKYLLELAVHILRECEIFIETGANVGSTLAYVARTHPNLQCISCEPDREAFEEAKKNTEKYSNVKLFNILSQDLIAVLTNDWPGLFSKKAVFWLDAHGYRFRWPLKDELRFITANFKSGYILIDDFKVPDLDCFAFDIYQEQVCSLDFIKDALEKKQNYVVYYPNYIEKTSPHHPLTGWGLIEFGHKRALNIPTELKNKIKGPLDV